MAGIWGQLPLTEGAALDARLDELAATVCREDPRTKEQRRIDALCAVMAGQQLRCGCGSSDCPAGGEDKPLGQVVIQVLAEQSSLNGASEAPGYLAGFGPVPAPLLRELAGSAKLKPLTLPPPMCESGYRPSAALAQFVRCRDLCCRFPGCDKPAEVCEIDHTIPYPLGPTHPSNLKLLCVFHHLLKTFYIGAGGWADKQLPDGTGAWGLAALGAMNWPSSYQGVPLMPFTCRQLVQTEYASRVTHAPRVPPRGSNPLTENRPRGNRHKGVIVQVRNRDSQEGV